jgi:hypothetical protein
MARFDPRILALVPVLLVAAACGDDAEPVAPASPPASVSAAPSVEPSPSEPPVIPEGSDPVYEEEDAEPTEAPGDLSGEVQSYLDEALGTELGALAAASPEVADGRRQILDKLPDNPAQVLTALKSYSWYSPEAKTAYDKAVAAAK